MGDIDVDFFQETLKELITSSKFSLIINEKYQLQSLEDEIKFLRRFLKVTEKKRHDHPEVMKLVKQIRDLVAEAENIVELFVVQAFEAANHASCSLHEHQDHLSLKLERVRKGMKTLRAEVQKIYDENMYNINGGLVKQIMHSSTGSGGASRGSHTSIVVKEKVVVGFEKEVENLMEKLVSGESKPLEIISIIGAGGGGKTTLAGKVYDHPFTLHAFKVRAWIDVSQDYDDTRMRDLLIPILGSVTPGHHQNIIDDKLGEEVHKCLKGKKYLIVMDDIWNTKAWNDIQRSFPKECRGSKVLFTSRLHVQPDNIGYFPHHLAALPTDYCWELLEKKVFGMKRCPPELECIGKEIAEKCNGLPLAVVTIAGILAMEDKTPNVWEEIANHLSSIIAKKQESCMEILELSYNHLPLHLKACFLYIGGYPEDHEIHVRELIWLWIAEGFIQQSEGRVSFETIAKDYLNDLINRSLVQVASKSPLGVIKACRIHDLLRELCLKIAVDDNFLVNLYKENYSSRSATNKHRRLFIGSHIYRKNHVCHRNLRSFVYLNHPSKRWGDDTWSYFVESYKLLRVLNLQPAHHTYQGETGIRQLVHLRYLAITLLYFCSSLPFSCLLNLITLNVLAPIVNRAIPLPRDIFKMVKLRHLYSKNGVFTFHLSSEEAGRNGFDHSSDFDSLQTLHKICACEACQSFLVRTPHLRKLGLLVEMTPEDNVLRFPDLEFLKCLEKLTVSAKNAMGTTMERTLPPRMKLPLTITRITFKNTKLKWEELSILQTLPSLEVLQLIHNGCYGPVWNISDGDGFPQLKYLRFRYLDIFEEWNASEYQFPKLEVLVLEFCRKLEQIPFDFGNLSELREIKLEGCRRPVEASARKIQEEQRNRKGDDDCLNLIPDRWDIY